MRAIATVLATVLSMASVAAAQDAAPTSPPPPPSGAAAPAAGSPAVANLPPPSGPQGVLPPGQWVSTGQYGWVWMPYDQSYLSQPVAAGGDPYEYMYSPEFGWCWLAAPWVFGIGPQPYFGVYGYSHFAWYGHGWGGRPWYGYARGYPSGYRGVATVYHGRVPAQVVRAPHGTAYGRRAPQPAPRHIEEARPSEHMGGMHEGGHVR